MGVWDNSLSDEELVELIGKGESFAFDKLRKRYKDTIYSIAGKIFSGKQNIGWASIVDAIEEGEVGLSRAVWKYKSEEGHFKNYAGECIKGYILNYINRNKSLVIPPTIQKKVNMVIKVADELKKFSNDYNELVDFIQNNEDSIKKILHERYPKEDWDDFWDECLHILNIREGHLDQTNEDENGRKSNLYEVIPSKNPSPLKEIEHKETHGIFRNIYKKGMHEIIDKYSQGKRNNILKKILERYYICGEEESSLIASLNNSGYKGDTLLRQIKSRFKKEICRNHIDIIYSIVKKLNEYFDFTYIGSEDPFCDDFINLCEAVIKLGLLKEDES